VPGHKHGDESVRSLYRVVPVVKERFPRAFDPVWGGFNNDDVVRVFGQGVEDCNKRIISGIECRFRKQDCGSCEATTPNDRFRGSTVQLGVLSIGEVETDFSLCNLDIDPPLFKSLGERNRAFVVELLGRLVKLGNNRGLRVRLR
jgi:hypothetical protein